MVLFVCHKCHTTAQTGAKDSSMCALDSRWMVFTPDERSGDLNKCSLCKKEKEKHVAEQFCNRDGWTLGHWKCCLCARGNDRENMCGHCQARIEHFRAWKENHAEVISIKEIEDTATLERLRMLVSEAEVHYGNCWRYYGKGGAVQSEQPIDQETLKGYFHGLLITSTIGINFLASLAGGRYLASLNGVLRANGFGSKKVLELLDFKHQSLVEIDVSGNPDLDVLPLKSFALMHSLEGLDCQSCPRLFSPPEEVAVRGGKATMAFVRGIVRQGLENTTMPLFFLGDTCAGKSSLINAMCSKIGKSPAISKHMRTIGVDVVPWQALENLKFTVFDVGGMDMYKSTSQQFLSRRAMYVVVWSASDDPDNWERCQQGVRNTLESLQIRIPGATFLLVVTHVDMCTQQSLDKQILAVQKAARSVMESGVSTNSSLTACLDCMSLPVNCTKGVGVEEFKEALFQCAMDRKSYGEMLPESFHLLRSQISRLRAAGVVRIPFSEYAAMTASCGITGDLLKVVTAFFHDTFVIQFFGDVEMALNGFTDKHDVLSDTVYIAPRWMFEAFKGVIRHEHNCVIEYLNGPSWQGEAEDRMALLRCFSLLQHRGILTAELLPFLMPNEKNDEKSVAYFYWNYVRGSDEHAAIKERHLWGRMLFRGIIRSSEDEKHILALLSGCRLAAPVMNSISNYIVPALISKASVEMDGSAFVKDHCCYWGKYVMSSIPPGAFEALVIALYKHFPDARISSTGAMFYKNGMIVVLRLIIETKYPQLLFGCSLWSQYELIRSQIEVVMRLYPGNQMLAMPRKKVRSTDPAHVVWVCATPIKAGEEVDYKETDSSGGIGRTPSTLSRAPSQGGFGRTMSSAFGKSFGRLGSMPRRSSGVLDGPPPLDDDAPSGGGGALGALSKLKKVTKGVGFMKQIQAGGGFSRRGSIASVVSDTDGPPSESDPFEMESASKAAQRNVDLGVGPPPVWDSKMIDGLARTMTHYARGLNVKCQIPMSRNIVEQQQNFTKPACCALICLDANCDLENLSIIVQERRAEGSVIVPVLLPGYSPPQPPPNASGEIEQVSWWPKALPSIDDTIPYVDLREASETDVIIQKILSSRVTHIVEHFRRPLPSVNGYGPPAEHIQCPECVERGDVNPAVFDREQVVSTLSEWTAIQCPPSAETPSKPEAHHVVTCGAENGDKHTCKAIDVVQFWAEDRDAVSCPRCAERGETPPHGFPLTLINGGLHYGGDRPVHLNCPVCRSRIPTREVINSRIFISYSRGGHPARPPPKDDNIIRSAGFVSGLDAPSIMRVPSSSTVATDAETAAEVGLEGVAKTLALRLGKQLHVGVWLDDASDFVGSEGTVIVLLDDEYTLQRRSKKDSALVLSQAINQLADAVSRGKIIVPVILAPYWSHGTTNKDWWFGIQSTWTEGGGDPSVPWHRCADFEPIICEAQDLSINKRVVEESHAEFRLLQEVSTSLHRGLVNTFFRSDMKSKGRKMSQGAADNSPILSSAFSQGNMSPFGESDILNLKDGWLASGAASPRNDGSNYNLRGGISTVKSEKSRVYPENGISIRSSFWQKAPFQPKIADPLPAEAPPIFYGLSAEMSNESSASWRTSTSSLHSRCSTPSGLTTGSSLGDRRPRTSHSTSRLSSTLLSKARADEGALKAYRGGSKPSPEMSPKSSSPILAPKKIGSPPGSGLVSPLGASGIGNSKKQVPPQKGEDQGSRSKRQSFSGQDDLRKLAMMGSMSPILNAKKSSKGVLLEPLSRAALPPGNSSPQSGAFSATPNRMKRRGSAVEWSVKAMQNFPLPGAADPNGGDLPPILLPSAGSMNRKSSLDSNIPNMSSVKFLDGNNNLKNQAGTSSTLRLKSSMKAHAGRAVSSENPAGRAALALLGRRGSAVI